MLIIAVLQLQLQLHYDARVIAFDFAGRSRRNNSNNNNNNASVCAAIGARHWIAYDKCTRRKNSRAVRTIFANGFCAILVGEERA